MRPCSILAGLTVLGLALAPTATLAAKPRAAKPQPSAEQIAAARARADGMIAATGAPELFRNVSEGDTPRVVHLPSKLLCYFDADVAGDSIEIGAGQDQDDVVTCTTADGDITRRLSASRAGGTGAADERAQTKAATLRSAQPGAGPVARAEKLLTWKLGVPLPVYSFQARGGGVVTTTNVSAIDAQEWALTQETTLADKDARVSSMVAQSLSEIYLSLTLYEMSGITRNGEPVTVGEL